MIVSVFGVIVLLVYYECVWWVVVYGVLGVWGMLILVCVCWI